MCTPTLDQAQLHITSNPDEITLCKGPGRRSSFRTGAVLTAARRAREKASISLSSQPRKAGLRGARRLDTTCVHVSFSSSGGIPGWNLVESP
eukprot:525146-Amorphochlora_amoeboformis.AAC.2